MTELSRQQLRDRLEARFKLTEEIVRVGGYELLFTRVADPDAVLDAVCLEEERRSQNPDTSLEPLRIPYWAAVWESANALGEFALSMRQDWSQTYVLDLGCGMGNAGMILAAAGARVVLADIDKNGLLFAELNTFRWRESCSVRCVDWNADRLEERFDLILGSDVLYERDQWDGFEAFVKTHLKVGGAILIGEPGRAQAEPFPQWIYSRGWAVEQQKRSLLGRETPINIFVLRRKR